MKFLTHAAAPPQPYTQDGATRRVGVEIEFAAVTAAGGAVLVQQAFGGQVVEEDAHRYHIEGTEFGNFTCELDTQYAHRPYGEEGGVSGFQTEMRKLFGDISSVVTPCEIVCPPISFSDLPHIDALVQQLTAAGAVGTRASPFYAFGAQLNPEIPSRDTENLTATLKAYLLLSGWLRGIMGIDFTRRAVAFADPFPKPYVAKVLDPGYWPDEGALIDDYLAANPTRNRELDLLPLFGHLDEPRVRAKLDDPRIKPRPTFHYRLPDANIGMLDWSLCLEWNRWVVVERLAADRSKLAAMGADYIKHMERGRARDWPLLASEWLILP
ncbi:amidoligase family protein [Meridianimarinicoccus aquatilis]|uniref:Amidoligase enzyme n=1 Tax=Meridianimarinicoccus aquatilis TaxID=2552766 RepID=A0A4R6AZ75_9RHOB|nr:amidoligase family protein [Fluviibacterium aquatile]QIE43614.1 amidoligase enzyme [Rhodobacteraceae bacterium SC52]TDL88178.1 amidoligase enzyme [Fluviibacterium aquatile]